MKLKIGYSHLVYNIEENIGFLKKIESIQSAISKQKLDMDLILFTCSKMKDVNVKNIRIIELKFKNKILRYFEYLYKFRKVFNDFDIVFTRNFSFMFIDVFFLQKKKFSLIVEIHGKLFEELKKQNIIKFYLYKIGRHCHSYNAFIGVTPSIEQYAKECMFDIKKIPSTTISNGVEVGLYHSYGYSQFKDDKINMIFIASKLNYYHGLDRILEGLLFYNGNAHINLYIVGNIPKKIIEHYDFKNNINVIFLGKCSHETLDNIMKNMNLAIGTLALHREKLYDGCVLKVREYMARGIPFVIGYNDIDLTDNLIFYKSVSSDDSLIDIEDLIKYVKELSFFEPLEISQQMRNYALQHIDYSLKLKAMFDFGKIIAEIYRGK